MHPNKNLQKDWKVLGSENFEFKNFDEMKVKDTAKPDKIKQELNDILEMHQAELIAHGVLLYE